MEIRQVLRGNDTFFGASTPRVRAQDGKAAAAQPSTDRMELSRPWMEQMREQSQRLQTLLSQPADSEKESRGLLDMLDEPTGESQELDALSKELDVQMKCLKIAMNIMKGKKVPPEDERYLMENDPNGYKMAIAMKALVKEDKKECESVLDDEDKNGGETSASEESGEAAPAETSPDSSGEAAE